MGVMAFWRALGHDVACPATPYAHPLLQRPLTPVLQPYKFTLCHAPLAGRTPSLLLMAALPLASVVLQQLC